MKLKETEKLAKATEINTARKLVVEHNKRLKVHTNGSTELMSQISKIKGFDNQSTNIRTKNGDFLDAKCAF